MNISVFFQSFYLCFLVLVTVGPVFLTTANIAMIRGYKDGFFAILGCFVGDAIFILSGAFVAKAVVSSIPKVLLVFLTLFAGCYLLKIAYGFWKTDVANLKTKDIKKTNFALSIKMLLLTLSSPLSIIGYGTIFSQIIDGDNSILSVVFGGICAAFFTHLLIVVTFATIGKKINVKILSLLNKISAILISFFAILLLFNFCKSLLSLIF